MVGYDEVAEVLLRGAPRVVALEVLVGVLEADVARLVRALRPDVEVDTRVALKPPAEVEAMLAPELGDDRVFGFITRRHLVDFFIPSRLAELREQVAAARGRVVVHGPGASLVTRADRLALLEMPRWETQARQRAHRVGNLGLDNHDARPGELYRRSYFVDWRVCDRHKKEIWRDVDVLVDTSCSERPVAVARSAFERALDLTARRPFRVEPFFDPAPWGGQWMKEVCDLDRDVDNFGWCFDCVPEENTLVFGFGDARFATPATNLVFQRPRELLGEGVFGRFGDEFPIRFDFLDTVAGGNLSLQVHPLTRYIQENFGVAYTQDESYYLLDTDAGASVYLGVRPDADPAAMAADLRAADDGGAPFLDERHVNRFPARRHDHFLIPAGTVHCSGRDALVLEISATPYIFTFKLWDWGRLGLDGEPRPIHLDHGLANVQWERDEDYARGRLVNRVAPVRAGDGWREERTGLHEAEFIETRRHWFTAPVLHQAYDRVNVLNLVQGREARVESPDRAFEPFTVHFAETFIVPAAAGPYRIRPVAPEPHSPELATIKAFVRDAACD